MKGLLVIFFLVAAAKALHINWDTLEDIEMDIEPVDISPNPNTTKLNPLIVGGSEALPHSFPFQAKLAILQKNGKNGSCGGSLISRISVLTAAHCVDNAKGVIVLLGAHKLDSSSEPSQVRLRSPRIIIHPYWSSRLVINDIAIVKLPEPVKLNEHISLVTLPSRYNSYTNEIAIVSGWGKTASKSPTSVILRYTSSQIITCSECKSSYGNFIPRVHICTSGKGGKGSCNGDSGGPLTIKKYGKFTQIGIVSFGHRTGCEKGYPSVYSRVTAYTAWIKENTGVTINYVAAGQQQLLMLYFLVFFILNNSIRIFI